MKKVLIIDDDDQVRFVFSDVLRNDDTSVVTAVDGTDGLCVFEQEQPDIILLDMKMPGMNGMDVLKELKQKAQHVPVIMITAHGDVPTAVQAIKLGAYDFLLKPPDLDLLPLVVERAWEHVVLQNACRCLREGIEASLEGRFGVSVEARSLAARIAQLAATELTVVIEGETGVGKSLVARAIHDFSSRAKKPFLKIDMSTVAESVAESELFGHEKGAFTGADRRKAGFFEVAHGGTIFIDEIENMSPLLQTKLLRVVEEKVVVPIGSSVAVPVDVRILAATNRRLKDLVAQGKFREDLLFRLGEFLVAVPPLRIRSDDILYLAHGFLEEAFDDFKKNLQLSPAAEAKLCSHRWPGNVRELRNVIRRAVFLAEEGTINPQDIEFVGESFLKDVPVEGSCSLHQEVKRLEKQLIEKALKQTQSNKSRAAALLGIDFKTLSSKIRELGITF